MAAAPPPGWTGTKITDPVLFIESILGPFLPEENETIPTYDKLEDLSYTGGLIIEHPQSIYQYQTLPSLNLTRIGANGNGNCWFDSFLFSLSPSYRTFSTADRAEISSKFRGWCGRNAEQIFQSMPKRIIDKLFLNKETFISNIPKIGTEIDALDGLIIAWFFGVNCVYFATPGSYATRKNETSWSPVCESMIQSPDCKVVCMIWAVNHFEPLVQAAFTVKDGSTTLNENDSKTVFSWNDPILCNIIKIARKDCKDHEIMKLQPWKVTCAAAGGRRRRRTTRKSIRRRKATRKTRK